MSEVVVKDDRFRAIGNGVTVTEDDAGRPVLDIPGGAGAESDPVALAALTTHEADATNVHGIADTAQVALKNAAQTFTEDQTIEAANALVFANSGSLHAFTDGAIIWAFNAAWNGTNNVRRFASNHAARVYLTAGGNLIFETNTDAGNTVGSVITWGEKFRIYKDGRTSYAALKGVYTAGDTTPSVAGGVTLLNIGNSSPTTITNLDDGIEGQVITLKFDDANTTINRDNAYLSGGVNFVSTSSDTLTLVKNGIYWFEVSRSVNA